REVLLGDRYGFGLVLDHDVQDAVRLLHADRADLLGAIDAKAAALDHRRPAHADGGVACGDDDVADPGHRRIAGEAAARDDADHRRDAAHLRPVFEAAGEAAALGVAWPPAAALAEEDGR